MCHRVGPWFPSGQRLGMPETCFYYGRNAMLAVRTIFGLVVASLAILPARADLPPNFLDQVIVSDLEQVTGVTFAADGRMIVWEKAGRVWTVMNGVRDEQPLIDISEEVGDWGDHGLLAVALDPD